MDDDDTTVAFQREAALARQGRHSAPSPTGPPTPPPSPSGHFGMPPQQRDGMGTAALVLGILGLVLFLVPLVGFVLGLLALIFGVIGRKRVKRGEASNGGAATAGLVLGLITTVANVVVVVAVFGTFITSFFLGFQNYANNQGANPAATYQQYMECLTRAREAGSPGKVQLAVNECQRQFGQQPPGGATGGR